MGRKLRFRTVDSIIAKVQRDYGMEDLSDMDIIEWIGEALEAISPISVYEEAIAFIEIKNHRGDLPVGIHAIKQIAKSNRWQKEDDSCKLTPAEVILDQAENTIKKGVPGEQMPLTLDCRGRIIGDYEVAYYRPYFDIRYEHSYWFSSKCYQDFSPVRLSSHNFFSSLVCEEDPGLYKNMNVTDEYSIQNDQIITSFKEGMVAVAFYRTMLDPKTGYPMVPDDISASQAISYYIAWRVTTRLFYLGKEGSENKMLQSEKQWVHYCNQFGNSQMLPYGIDQYENLKDISKQFLPQLNNYYGYFGKLTRPQMTNTYAKG